MLTQSELFEFFLKLDFEVAEKFREQMSISRI